jgi:hypothetical protein
MWITLAKLTTDLICLRLWFRSERIRATACRRRRRAIGLRIPCSVPLPRSTPNVSSPASSRSSASPPRTFPAIYITMESRELKALLGPLLSHIPC